MVLPVSHRRARVVDWAATGKGQSALQQGGNPTRMEVRRQREGKAAAKITLVTPALLGRAACAQDTADT